MLREAIVKKYPINDNSMHTEKNQVLETKTPQKYLYILPECHFVTRLRACELFKLMSQLKNNKTKKSKIKHIKPTNKKSKSKKRIRVKNHKVGIACSKKQNP